MNNLYDKIYEAVNAGIQKALIIDNGQSQDVSVKFQHKKVSADISVLGQYVQSLLNSDEPVYCYQVIVDYCQKNKEKYKVADFEELSNIYTVIVNAYGKVSYDYLWWIDMDNAVSIIMEDGSEMPFSEHMKNKDSAVFIKMKNHETGHDIILHTELLYGNDLEWKAYEHYAYGFNPADVISEISQACHDYNGYEHTYHNANPKEVYPAFDYCKNKSTNEYEGYLPAMGEMAFLKRHNMLISYLTYNINNIIFDETHITFTYSSTEASEDKVYIYNLKDAVYAYFKHDWMKFGVLPLFHKIEK